jgi:hypothetical protein
LARQPPSFSGSWLGRRCGGWRGSRRAHAGPLSRGPPGGAARRRGRAGPGTGADRPPGSRRRRGRHPAGGADRRTAAPRSNAAIVTRRRKVWRIEVHKQETTRALEHAAARPDVEPDVAPHGIDLGLDYHARTIDRRLDIDRGGPSLGSRDGNEPNTHPQTRRTYLFRGVIVHDCGRRMNGNHRHHSTYYMCHPKANNRGLPDKYARHAKAAYIREDLILDAVSAFYTDRVFGRHRRELLAAEVASTDNRETRQRDAQREQLQRTLADLARRQNNVMRQAQDSDPDDPFTKGLRQTYNDLEAERQAAPRRRCRTRRRRASRPRPTQHSRRRTQRRPALPALAPRPGARTPPPGAVRDLQPHHPTPAQQRRRDHHHPAPRRGATPHRPHGRKDHHDHRTRTARSTGPALLCGCCRCTFSISTRILLACSVTWKRPSGRSAELSVAMRKWLCARAAVQADPGHAARLPLQQPEGLGQGGRGAGRSPVDVEHVVDDAGGHRRRLLIG